MAKLFTRVELDSDDWKVGTYQPKEGPIQLQLKFDTGASEQRVNISQLEYEQYEQMMGKDVTLTGSLKIKENKFGITLEWSKVGLALQSQSSSKKAG